MASIWITGNVFGDQFSTIDSPRDFLNELHLTTCKDIEKQSLEQKETKTSHTSEDRQNQGTIPMPTFAPIPLTTSSTILVELPQNCMVGQQRQQISKLQVDKLLIHNRSWCGKVDSKQKSLRVLIFHRMLCCGTKKWRWLILWTSQNHRGQFMERIFHTSRCWTRRLIASAMNKIIQNSQFKKKVSLQEQKLGAVQNRYFRLFFMTPREGPIRPTNERTLFRKKPTISNKKPIFPTRNTDNPADQDIGKTTRRKGHYQNSISRCITSSSNHSLVHGHIPSKRKCQTRKRIGARLCDSKRRAAN